MARRYRNPVRRTWVVPALFNADAVLPGRVAYSLSDVNLPLGNQEVADGGTKIYANMLVEPANFRDPTGPAGSASALVPQGPYTIERIVGSVNMLTSETDVSAGPNVGLTILGVFDTGNPYEATGITPNIDDLRTQEGVMHCASGTVIAANAGPAVRTIDLDVRTKRTVVPGKSFYVINHTFNSGDENIDYLHVIKVLIRYAS